MILLIIKKKIQTESNLLIASCNPSVIYMTVFRLAVEFVSYALDAERLTVESSFELGREILNNLYFIISLT